MQRNAIPTPTEAVRSGIYCKYEPSGLSIALTVELKGISASAPARITEKPTVRKKGCSPCFPRATYLLQKSHPAVVSFVRFGFGLLRDVCDMM